MMLDIENVAKNTLELFNVFVTDNTHVGSGIYTGALSQGYILNFNPTRDERALLDAIYDKPLDMITLFTVEERLNNSVKDLLIKQIVHYFEVYGLNSPGLFNLEVNTGKIVTMRYIKGVSVQELSEMVIKLLTTNAPVKDANAIKQIIEYYNIDYDINAVANNELRVILYDVNRDKFNNGDDAARFVCFKATNNPLLIKSNSVIRSIKDNARTHNFEWDKFLSIHRIELANVFNRHKRIVLALKNNKTRTIINEIGRLSKKLHVPLHESFSKQFMHKALSNEVPLVESSLEKLSLRDKMKMLNLLEVKRLELPIEVYVVRNGKMHVKNVTKPYNTKNIDKIQQLLLNSIKRDLTHLRGKNIVLDDDVDYGLPVSRKQTLGNLPFGTTVTITNNDISAGVYWHEKGGANDIDLSVIDTEGQRVGWGQMSGYDNPEVIFSGDVTSAYNGAMEFITTSVKNPKTLGMFVNIFNGNVPSNIEVVIGKREQGNSKEYHSNNGWISDVKIREKLTLQSRGSIVGFIKNGQFIVYNGRLNDRQTSSNNSIIAKGLAPVWTVKKLLTAVDILYNLSDNDTVDYDLTYNQFSFDKLENLLGL